MCHAVVDGVAGLGVEPYETTHERPTYTIETLTALCLRNPSNEYTLIIGADQANAFQSWQRWQDILKRCQLAVVARSGAPVVWQADVVTELAKLQHKPTVLEMPDSTLSSTAIRAAIMNGESVANALPAAVARYIVEHSLYSKSENL